MGCRVRVGNTYRCVTKLNQANKKKHIEETTSQTKSKQRFAQVRSVVYYVNRSIHCKSFTQGGRRKYLSIDASTSEIGIVYLSVLPVARCPLPFRPVRKSELRIRTSKFQNRREGVQQQRHHSPHLTSPQLTSKKKVPTLKEDSNDSIGLYNIHPTQYSVRSVFKKFLSSSRAVVFMGASMVVQFKPYFFIFFSSL